MYTNVTPNVMQELGELSQKTLHFRADFEHLGGMRDDTREPVPRSRRLAEEGVGSGSGRRRVGAASEALA